MAKVRWALITGLVLAGMLLALLAVDSITTCPSCPTDPCPCTTDGRWGFRLIVLAIGLISALGVWFATRRAGRDTS